MHDITAHINEATNTPDVPLFITAEDIRAGSALSFMSDASMDRHMSVRSALSMGSASNISPFDDTAAAPWRGAL